MRALAARGRSVRDARPGLARAAAYLLAVLVLAACAAGVWYAAEQRRMAEAAYTALAVAAVIALLRRAENGVLLVIMTMPLMDLFVLPLLGVNVKASDWLAFLAIGVFLMRVPFDRTLSIREDLLKWPVLLYLLTGVFSTVLTYGALAAAEEVEGATGLNSLTLRTWTQTFWGVYSLMLYLMVFAIIRTRALLKTAVNVLLLTSAAVGVYALSGHRYWTGGGYRVLGTFSEPSYYAEWLILTLPLAVTLTMANGIRGGRLVQAGLILLLAANLFLTFSTGGYASAILSAVVLLFLSYRCGLIRRIGLSKFAVMGLAVWGVAVVLVFAFVPTARTSLQIVVDKVVNPERSEHSALLRERARFAAKCIFAENPVWGVGPGNYPFYRPQYVQDDPTAVDYERVGRWDPNNLYLEVLSERGVVGGVAFSLIWLVFFTQLLMSLKKARDDYSRALLVAFAAGFAGVLLGYYAHANFFRIYIWVLMGLAMAAARLAHEPAPETEIASPEPYSWRRATPARVLPGGVRPETGASP